MKKYAIQLLVLGAFGASWGQSVEQNFQLHNAKSSASVGFFKSQALPTQPSEIQAYVPLTWEVATFRFAEEEVKVPARINVYRETVELQVAGEVREVKLNRLENFAFSIEGKKRAFITLADDQDPGVYEILFASKSVGLYRRHYMKLLPATYVPAFDIGETHETLKVESQPMVMIDGVLKDLPKSEKKIVELFPQADRIKSYLKETNLSVKNEEDLIAVLRQFYLEETP